VGLEFNPKPKVGAQSVLIETISSVQEPLSCWI